MPKNRIIIVLGLLVALLPSSLFGFPTSWETFLQVVLGLLIVVLSTWATIDKYLSLKAKAHRRQAYKLKEAEIQEQGNLVENRVEDNINQSSSN